MEQSRFNPNSFLKNKNKKWPWCWISFVLWGNCCNWRASCKVHLLQHPWEANPNGGWPEGTTSRKSESTTTVWGRLPYKHLFFFMAKERATISWLRQRGRDEASGWRELKGEGAPGPPRSLLPAPRLLTGAAPHSSFAAGATGRCLTPSSRTWWAKMRQRKSWKLLLIPSLRRMSCGLASRRSCCNSKRIRETGWGTRTSPQRAWTRPHLLSYLSLIAIFPFLTPFWSSGVWLVSVSRSSWDQQHMLKFPSGAEGQHKVWMPHRASLGGIWAFWAVCGVCRVQQCMWITRVIQSGAWHVGEARLGGQLHVWWAVWAGGPQSWASPLQALTHHLQLPRTPDREMGISPEITSQDTFFFSP